MHRVSRVEITMCRIFNLCPPRKGISSPRPNNADSAVDDLRTTVKAKFQFRGNAALLVEEPPTCLRVF